MTAIRKGMIRTTYVLASVVAFIFGVAGLAPPTWAKMARPASPRSDATVEATTVDPARATDRFRVQLAEEEARLELAAADAEQPAQARRAIEAIEAQPQQARRATEATEEQPQQARRAKEAIEQPQQARRAKEATEQPQQARRAKVAPEMQPQQARRAKEATEQPQQARRAKVAPEMQPQQARRAKATPGIEDIEKAAEEVGETSE